MQPCATNVKSEHKIGSEKNGWGDRCVPEASKVGLTAVPISSGREADSDHQPWTFEILDWKIVLSLCFVESYRQEKGGYENGFDF